LIDRECPLENATRLATIARNVSPPKPQELSATVLGVDFRWKNPGPAWREPFYAGLDTIHKAILVHALPSVRRQKRTTLFYWDALTGILKGDLAPKAKGDREEWELAADLTLAIADHQLRDELILELGNFPPISQVRSRIAFFSGEKPRRSESALGRTDRITYDIRGRANPQEPGLYRCFELDAGDLEGHPEKIDWFQILSLGVLVQLRVEFELYIETGFFPVHCCERVACHAFFRVNRMAGRQRFCSNICRASAVREQ
jgi:hypothetical protein